MTDIAVLAGNHTCFEKIMPDSIDIHEHDVWEFMFFIKISGVYFMEGKAYRLHENDVLIIPPRIQHRIIMDSPSEYERYNVLFDASRLPKELKEMLPHINTVIHIEDNNVKSLLSSFDTYLSAFDKKTAFVGIDAILKAILIHMYLLSGASDRKQTSRVNPIITRATAYIQENLTSIDSVDDVCEALFITNSHLHHLFQKYLMTSPKKYIMSKRIFEAQRLIRSGTLPIRAASEVGFDNYATFYRNYKRFFGHSPSEENMINVVREQYF